MRRGAYMAVVLCLFGLSARADPVVLKNGDRLTGAIIKSDTKTLLIKTALAGDVNLQWEGIASIISSQPLYLWR